MAFPQRQADPQYRELTDSRTKPFQGGMNTYNEPALLPYGTYSELVNMRQMHPGLKQRPGYMKQHSTANSTLKALTLFQYSKGKRTERHFYCQWSDSTIQEATTAPPGTTTGAFGSTVFTGTASPLRGSWSVINDKLLFSNGVDQHQICAGTDDYIDMFVTYSSATTLPAVPSIGTDYTEQVTDTNTATFAVLGALGTNATDCVLVDSQIQSNRAYFGMTANVNTNASVATVQYWNGAWQTVSGFTDGTIGSAGKTLSQSGYMTWTQPTDAIPKYLYNQYGFWIKITFNAALSATVQAHTCNFGSGFTSLQNLWDGVLVDAIEAQLVHTNVYTMGTSAITIGAMTSSDTLSFNTSDPAEMLYIDVGNTPNTNASVMTVAYLNTAGTWTTISGTTDGTIGVAGKTLSQSGFVVLGRQATIKAQQYNNLPYQSYWYRITVSQTLSGTALSDLSIGIQSVPYYKISDFGIGICNATWKDRGVFTFDKNPEYIVMSANGNAQILSSSDSAIYKVGDGRSNKILAMKPFYNELLCAQEEKGNDGGCITLVQGTTPANLGKVILSNYYGVMNSQSLCVIDGFTFGQKEPGIVAFGLSKRGIWYTDGRGVQFVPNFWMVKNYFDPSNSECIGVSKEAEMFIRYDSSYNILVIGLVIGNSSAVVNKWLIYDLKELAFSEDVYAYPLACMTEAEGVVSNVTGSVALADLTLVLTDGSAAVDFNSATVPKNYLGSFITIYDSASKKITGYIRAASGSTGVTIVNTSGGVTRNWTSIDQVATVSEGATDMFPNETHVDTANCVNQSFSTGYYQPTTATGALDSYYDTGQDDHTALNNPALPFAQTFKPSGTVSISKVSLELQKSNSPTDNVVVRIETTSAGLPTGTLVNANATVAIAASGVDTSMGWMDFTFPASFTLSSGTTYAIVVARSGAVDYTNRIYWGTDVTSPTYADGSYCEYSGGWSANTGRDLMFRTYLVGAINNMTLISNSTEAMATINATATFSGIVEPIDALTLNIDIKGWLSEDDGAHYDQVTLTNLGSYDAVSFTYGGTVSLTNYSDKTMRIKLTSLNNKNFKIHGWTMSWTYNVAGFNSADASGYTYSIPYSTVPVLQMGGGTADGTVYVLNTGLNDVNTSIDSYGIIELNAQGMKVRAKEMNVRVKAQATGSMTVTPAINGVDQTPYTLALTAENSGDTIRRHKLPSPTNLATSNASLTFEHNAVSESFYLLDWGIEMEDYSKQ